MHLHEAYQILNLNQNASEDEIKKSFRKLAAKYHPDTNKDSGAEDNFKKVNEAYQLLTKKPEQHQDPFANSGFSGFSRINIEDIFNVINNGGFGGGFGFNNQNFVNIRPRIAKEISISFQESMLGCVKTSNIKRKVRCPSECNGTGTIFRDKSTCSTCGGSGSIDQESEFRIEIPPGIESDQLLVIRGATDYLFDKRVNRAMHVDCCIKVNVTPEVNMQVSGRDIVSVLDLTLLEALKGTVKKVKTIKGEMTLKINKNIKHGDSIRVNGYGVASVGAHVFLIQISYPNDCGPIIEALEKQENKD